MPLVRAEEIRRVAVLGAGTMGHGIAQISALAGCDVRLCDVSRSAVERGLARIRENLEKGVAKGKVTQEASDSVRSRLAGTTSIEDAASGSDLIIEAIPEVIDLKRSTFESLDRCAPAHALLATNTSSLSVARIAAATARPEHVVGLHFFNPPHIMKLLEVVHHEKTSDDAVSCARSFAVRLGKEPIVVRDVPGFASSRLGILLGLEAIRMLESGVASAEDIDRAMKLGYGHPMGPLELTDLVGLDIRLQIAEYLERELGSAFRPPELLRRKVADGKLGKKTGEGFFRW